MANKYVRDQDQRANDYLQMVHSIVRELEQAMLAISLYRLRDFEESLSEQIFLTGQLMGLHGQLWGSNSFRPANVPIQIDPLLAQEIAVADAELYRVSRVYEAVVQQSHHSASLMSSLLDSFQGDFQEASGARLKYQTWSCQM